MRPRAYLDWNASAPLRPEARAAMLAAMDEVGNPSSVHAEGRAARAIVERAREAVAALAGCAPDQVVFTSGATEANAAAISGAGAVIAAEVEHESVLEPARAAARHIAPPVDRDGRVARDTAAPEGALIAIAAANGETGVIEDEATLRALFSRPGLRGHCDATQAVGRTGFDFARSDAATAAISAHKIGGPKGVGAFIHRAGAAPAPLIRGGGQESGWRSGTENLIGIAGFGAAAKMAKREFDAGAWDGARAIRDLLEDALASGAPEVEIAGRDAPRLPNTSCFITPGWAGETQVMAMDLAGFAVSAGSACSSGKVRRASRALLAMGHDETTASSAIRVSFGPTTTEAEVMAFAEAWLAAHGRRRAKAA